MRNPLTRTGYYAPGPVMPLPSAENCTPGTQCLDSGIVIGRGGGLSTSKIPFVTTNDNPVLTLNYASYKSMYGNSPLLALYTTVSGEQEDVSTAPIITRVIPSDITSDIVSITWEFPLATTGYIQLSGGTAGGSNGQGAGTTNSFLELTDAPKSYSGGEGKAVAVKNDGTGLTFINVGATRISRDDARWENIYMLIEPAWAGANFFVYANGNKILTPELEGFAILTGGGFMYDPAKFQFYEGDFLYVIF